MLLMDSNNWKDKFFYSPSWSSGFWAQLGWTKVDEYQKNIPTPLLAALLSIFSFFYFSFIACGAVIVQVGAEYITWSDRVWRVCISSLCKTGISVPESEQDGHYAFGTVCFGTLPRNLKPLGEDEWRGGQRKCFYVLHVRSRRWQPAWSGVNVMVRSISIVGILTEKQL